MRRVVSPIYRHLWHLVIACWCCLSLVSPGIAQDISEEVDTNIVLPPVLTHSPRDTLQSLQNLRDELISAYVVYQSKKTSDQYQRLVLIGDALISLLDLTEANVAERRDTSIRTALALLDIVEKVPSHEFDTLPDSEQALGTSRTSFPVPGTPLVIQRLEEGPREGEFLFSANASRVAPRYLRQIALESPERLDTLWSTRFLQLSGPWIPLALQRSLPPSSRTILWGTPLWKIFFTAFFLCAMLAFLWVFGRWLRRCVVEGRMKKSAYKLLFYGTTFTAFVALDHFFNSQLFLTGTFALSETFYATIAIYIALALTFWHFMGFLSDMIKDHQVAIARQYDESMMRLLNHIVALVGAIWILAYGAQTLGFPLLSIIAGLGVGGLAVALAIRPTLENLISGFVIYIEKAVKVGDYCSFPGQEGTIERIGVRSTHIRGLDRTTIAIPNSRFVNMDLINWARCDEMMIRTTLGLRYETNTDQLRFVLAEIRSMMYAHPRITSETARVRFIGYGESSLNIEIRVYAQTREWNDFYAIQEDVLFRTKEIVESSGTGFAFPSQTVYVSKDGGLDEAKSKQAVNEVARLRRRHNLPFPNFSSAEREQLEGTLRYPPRGSPEFNGPDEDQADIEEPLSVEEPLSIDDPAPEEAKEDDADTKPEIADTDTPEGGDKKPS